MRFRLLLLVAVLAFSVGVVQAQAAPGNVYTVDGRAMHLWCTGTGDETVLLEAGVGGFTLNWALVQPGIAAFARVCSYDRAGYGWSDPLPEGAAFSPAEAAADLRALLDAAGERTPLTLVAHSFGGVVGRQFAADYPDTVRAMVLLVSGPATFAAEAAAYPPALETQFLGIRVFASAVRLRGGDFGEPPEEFELPPGVTPQDLRLYQNKLLEPKFLATSYIEAQYMAYDLPTYPLADDFGDLPLWVVARGERETRSFLGAPMSVTQAAETEAVWQALQREMATMSTRGVFMTFPTRHNMQFDEPERVIALVREVVNTE